MGSKAIKISLSAKVSHFKLFILLHGNSIDYFVHVRWIVSLGQFLTGGAERQ